MASTAYEIIHDIKDLPVDKDGFIRVVERYKNGRVKKIGKYLAEKSPNKEEARKLCENVLRNVKKVNNSIDAVNKKINLIKGLASLNAILGAANLCATVVGFEIMKQELNKIAKNIEDMKTTLQEQYHDEIDFKYEEVQGTYERMLDKKRQDEEFGCDELIELANKIQRTLNLFIKAFMKYDMKDKNSDVLGVVIALASMLSETAIYLYQEYYDKYSDKEDTEKKFYSYRKKWSDTLEQIESETFKERLYELYFIDKDLNQYESTLAMLETCNQVNELILNISDKEELLRYFDDIEDVDYHSFMREIDNYVDNEFSKELQIGAYSENLISQVKEAENSLQFAIA